MKLLIVHASAGAGHRKAAEAVYNYIRAHYPQEHVVLCDILDYANPLFRFFYREGYAFLINRAGWLWACIFFLTNTPLSGRIIRLLCGFTSGLNTSRFAQFLCDEQFDAILSTHFLPPEIAQRLRQKKRINSRIYCVITDYGVHPFWITPGVDAYIVATEQTGKILINQGVDGSAIRVFGIPIDERYSREGTRQERAALLGVKPGLFTVLAVTGSFGIGPLEEIARELSGEDIQVLIVCARNKKLKQRLDDKQYPGVKAFGFVDTMPELMSISDIIITKPGGLTVTEVLVSGLVPLFISAIPGQEIENVKVLYSYNVGTLVASVSKIKECVLDFKNNPERLRTARLDIQKIKKPFSVKDIYEFIRSSRGGVSG